jgi:glutamyl-tRNA reductase
VRDITITNRSPERGRQLVERLGFGTLMPMEQMPGRLHEFDIIIVSTGAREYLITYDMMRAAGSRRGAAPQLIVDISVPRNVDPRISKLSSVFCKDLNDLNSVIETNVEKRRAEIPRAELIIAEELAKFSAWCNLLPVTPVVAQLRQRSEEIMRGELEKNRHRFSEADFANIEKLVGSVVKKIIGMPMSHLLDVQNDLQHTLVKAEYVKVLFNLHDIEGEQQENGAGPAAGGASPAVNGNGGADAAARNGNGTAQGARTTHA